MGEHLRKELYVLKWKWDGGYATYGSMCDERSSVGHLQYCSNSTMASLRPV